jgi:hypothetical protein
VIGDDRSMVTFSLQAQPTTAVAWLDLARRAERAGFASLCAGTPPEALVQRFEVTDDAGATYATWAKEHDEDEADMAAAPYAFAGTLAEIKTKLGEIEREWGVARCGVRLPAVDAVEAIMSS